MKKLDFSDGKITGGWDFVKSYGSEVDFWVMFEFVCKFVRLTKDVPSQ